MSLIEVLGVESLSMGIYWDSVHHGVSSVKRSDSAMLDLSLWLQKKPEVDGRKGEIAEYNLASKYEGNIRSLFRKLIRCKFICNESFIPVRFARKEDGILFLVTHISSDYIYNTLKTSAKIRASKVISSAILPSMKDFYVNFRNTDLKYYGMMVVYGSKDFSGGDDAGNLKVEIVSLITSALNCKNFGDGAITDDEFIAVSEIYLRDRDAEDFMRVKVSLE
jgi:hypothetical protein